MTPIERALCDLAIAVVGTARDVDRVLDSLNSELSLCQEHRAIVRYIRGRVRYASVISNNDVAELVAVLGAAIRVERETCEPAPPTDPEGA